MATQRALKMYIVSSVPRSPMRGYNNSLWTQVYIATSVIVPEGIGYRVLKKNAG